MYWANRAFAHTKLEEYGSAISDATKAIELDPRYSKVRLRLIVTQFMHLLFTLLSVLLQTVLYIIIVNAPHMSDILLLLLVPFRYL